MLSSHTRCASCAFYLGGRVCRSRGCQDKFPGACPASYWQVRWISTLGAFLRVPIARRGQLPWGQSGCFSVRPCCRPPSWSVVRRETPPFSFCDCDREQAVDCLVEYLRALRARAQRAVFRLVGLIILDDVRVGGLSLDYDEGVGRLHELRRYLRWSRHGRGRNERPRSLFRTWSQRAAALLIDNVVATSGRVITNRHCWRAYRVGNVGGD